jgi:hypothetical protein
MELDLSEKTIWEVIVFGNRIYSTPPRYIAKPSNLKFYDRERYIYRVREDSHILEFEEKSSKGITPYEVTSSKPLSFDELVAIANSSNLCKSIPETVAYSLNQFGAGEITITKVSAT